MPSTINVTEADLFTALRAFLLAVIGSGTEVVKAQENRAAMPRGPFISMTPLFIEGLSTTVATYTPDAGERHDTRTTQFRVQLDFYGPQASMQAAIVAGIFRTERATELMADGPLQPLYAGEPVQTTMINGEQQFEDRWTLEVFMQFNPIITSSQDFADELHIDRAEIDGTFPPGDH